MSLDYSRLGVIENGRICQDNGAADGQPFGILDGGRKNQLAAEVVQFDREVLQRKLLFSFPLDLRDPSSSPGNSVHFSWNRLVPSIRG